MHPFDDTTAMIAGGRARFQRGSLRLKDEDQDSHGRDYYCRDSKENPERTRREVLRFPGGAVLLEIVAHLGLAHRLSTSAPFDSESKRSGLGIHASRA